MHLICHIIRSFPKQIGEFKFLKLDFNRGRLAHLWRKDAVNFDG